MMAWGRCGAARRPLATLGVLVLALLMAVQPAAAQPAATAPASAATDETTGDWWYVIRLDGAEIGWSRQWTRPRPTAPSAPDSAVKGSAAGTEIGRAMQLELRRADAEVSMGTEIVMLEDPAGRLDRVRMIATAGDASARTVTRWRFGPSTIDETVEQVGRTASRERPHPTGEWLGPSGVRELIRSRLEGGAGRITFRTIDPQTGLEAFDVTMERAGEDRLEVLGREIPVTRWTVRNGNTPGVTSEQWLSADGTLVRERTVMPIGTMEVRLTDERSARAALDGDAPEIMVRAFVTPDRPLRNARGLMRAVYRVRAGDGVDLSLPAAGAQTIKAEADADGWWTIAVDATGAGEAAAADDRPTDADRTASSMLDSADPAVRALVAAALEGLPSDASPDERTEALRRAVRGHIREVGLGQLMASASETARNGRGDCSEHAMLLTAMIRAAGIPARVAVGLVYADQFAGERDVFGWHMWTQAWIDDRWVDLDATLDRSYDAAHVLVGVDSMDQGSGSGELSSLLMLVGGLELEIVEPRDRRQ